MSESTTEKPTLPTSKRIKNKVDLLHEIRTCREQFTGRTSYTAHVFGKSQFRKVVNDLMIDYPYTQIQIEPTKVIVIIPFAQGGKDCG